MSKMRVTIEGRQGVGKTRLGQVIAQWCYANGMSTLSRDAEENSEEVRVLLSETDVEIIERQCDVDEVKADG